MFDRALHEDYMRKILKEIFSSEVSDFLGVKRGTLTYLSYELDRFSTDIDMDILNLEYEEKMNY